MNYFILFPGSLARGVLINWIDCRGVVVLDSAHCCKKQRAPFLSLAFQPETVFPFKHLQCSLMDSAISEFYVNWLLLRGAFVSSLSLPFLAPERSDPLVRKYLRKCGASLRKVELVGCDENLMYAHYDVDYALSCIAEHCPRLQELVLDRCKLERTDAIAQLLSDCTDLDCLSLISCWCDRKYCSIVSPLAYIGQHCRPLIQLSIHDGTVQLSTFHELIVRSPNLKSLTLANCEKYGNYEIELVAQKCKNLKEIYLARLTEVTDSALIEIITSCPQLTVFDIGSLFVTDSILLALVEHCSHLTHISLVNCSMIAGSAIVALINNCGENLKFLALDHNDQVTDVTLAAIGTSCKQLYELHLCYCASISDVGLLAVHGGIPDLHWLDIELSCSRRVSIEVSRLFNTALRDGEGKRRSEEGESVADEVEDGGMV